MAERVTRSIAFGALVRLVLVAARRLDADSGTDRMLARAEGDAAEPAGQLRGEPEPRARGPAAYADYFRRPATNSQFTRFQKCSRYLGRALR